MRPKRQYGDYLQDTMDHANKAMQFVGDITFGEFADNEEKVLAVVKTLEIVGEAARHLPKSMRVLVETSWGVFVFQCAAYVQSKHLPQTIPCC